MEADSIANDRAQSQVSQFSQGHGLGPESVKSGIRANV
jgi:hypothetical protein